MLFFAVPSHDLIKNHVGLGLHLRGYLYLHPEDPVPIGHILFGHNLSDDLQSQGSPCCLIPKSKETVAKPLKKCSLNFLKYFTLKKDCEYQTAGWG